MKASKYRKLKLLILILIAVFILWNAVWYMNYSTYAKFTSGYLKSPVNYVKSGDHFTYTVDPPSYLRLTGNFAITNNKELSLIIWPSLFMKGKAKYGIGIEDESTDLIYRFYVDEELNYIHVSEMNYAKDEEIYVEKLLDEHRSSLLEMYTLAKDEWHL